MEYLHPGLAPSAAVWSRHIFVRVTVLVAVNGNKRPASTQSERAVQVRRTMPADWENVPVAEWAGLIVEFCGRRGAGVIVRGVRNRSDLSYEYELAAMNEVQGITTLFLPARPGLAGMSSTLLHGLARD